MEQIITFNNSQFKHIANTKHAYVSKNGQVLSVINGKMKLIYGATDSMGYTHFRFTMIDGSKKLMKLHRIVMMTFNPHPDANKLVVDHIDEQKQNNNLHNLRWLSRSNNTTLYFANRKANGEKCFSSKLTSTQIELIRTLRHIELPIATIAKEMGTNYRRVVMALKNTSSV